MFRGVVMNFNFNSPCAHRIRPLTLSITLLAACVLPLAAQDYKFTVSTTQSWTDTGIDLQAGDVVAITATPHGGSSCDPTGAASTGASQNLPVASALPGALIARLQDNGVPTLVGASQQLRVAQAGHLYLGANNDTNPVCQGSFAVKVHISSGGSESGMAAAATPAESLAPKANEGSKTSNPAPAAGQATSANGEKDVTDIKGALSTAAQTWLSGQFGMGNKTAAATSSSATSGNTTDVAGATGNSATAAPELKISKSPLDSQLRKDIDSLPRRVNDQFQNQGDMVNFVIVGSLQKMQDALTAADWHVADRDVKESVLKAALETYQKKAYLAMPMSELYLFGRVQDYGYEQAEPYAVVASRHHFRVWKAPFQWNGQDVWAGAGTHDIGFEKDQRNGSVTHKIDPAVDGERDNIGATLQKTGKVKSMNYYLPPDPVMGAKNATGGGYHSNGQILVVQLQ
jgi:LssY C-terminus